jgi:hypothetical protein
VPVQPAVPTKPFFASVSLPAISNSSTSQITGPGSGRFAITSITATNHSSSQTIAFEVSNINFSSGTAGSCAGTPNADIAPLSILRYRPILKCTFLSPARWWFSRRQPVKPVLT